MFKKINIQEQINNERQRSLQQLSKQIETEAIIIESLVDMSFRQSLLEMEVDLNDL